MRKDREKDFNLLFLSMKSVAKGKTQRVFPCSKTPLHKGKIYMRIQRGVWTPRRGCILSKSVDQQVTHSAECVILFMSSACEKALQNCSPHL